MSRTTVLPAHGRAQAPVPSTISPLEMVATFCRVYGRYHSASLRRGWIRGTYWECDHCGCEAVDRGDGLRPACEMEYATRLLGRVPQQVVYYSSRVHRQEPVVPRIPEEWVR